MGTREQLERQIIEKAMKDEAFRKKLIADPKYVLEQEMGMKLPNSLDIKVLEEDAQTFYLVLPQNPALSEDGELSEAELEGVSGGWGGDTSKLSCIISECMT